MLNSILKYINWVDIIIVILLLRSGYVGYRSGLGRETSHLISIIAGVIVSFQSYRLLGNLISSHSFVSSLYSNVISFILLLILTIFIAKLIMVVIGLLMRVEFVPAIENRGGLLLGLIQGGIVASLVLIILVWLPFAPLEKAIIEDSYFGPTVLKISPAIHNSLIRIFPGKDALTTEQLLEADDADTKDKGR